MPFMCVRDGACWSLPWLCSWEKEPALWSAQDPRSLAILIVRIKQILPACDAAKVLIGNPWILKDQEEGLATIR